MSLDMIEATSKILEFIPKEAGVTRIEYEGSNIAIYSKKPSILLNHGYLMTEIALKIKKRVISRSEPSERLDTEISKKKIDNIMNGISSPIHKFFDPAKGEVTLYLEKNISQSVMPALSLEIISQTNWFPIFRRYFSPFSKTITLLHGNLTKWEKERRQILLSLGDRVFREPINPSTNLSLTALGGAEEVGRSCYLLSTSETKILIDFGLKPGFKKKIQSHPRLDITTLNIDELDAIVLTHAHLDHSGLIPFVFKHGFKGVVYMTEPTLPLVTLLLQDLIDVAERNGEIPPYNHFDIRTMINHTIPLKYGQVVDISPDMKLTFQNAGHILGSALAHIHITDGVHNILFTGDFKYGETSLLDSAYSNFSRLETVVMESTYGGPTDITPSKPQSENMLLQSILKSLNKNGKVLMPVPAVGRSQEVLMILDRFIKQNLLPDVPIYLDGMIEESTSIHVSFINYLSNKLRASYTNEGLNPFSSDHFINVNGYEGRQEALSGGPCIILATSGMMEGGPVLEYFRNFAENENNSLIFVSYQVAGTLGRRILDGLENVIIPSKDKMLSLNVHANISRLSGFSGHSDRNQLMAYIKKISRSTKNVYTVHGEASKSLSLAKSIKEKYRINASPLKITETISLS